VFAPEEFVKAGRSSPDKDCVEVARRDGWVELRDDKLKDTLYYDRVALRLTEAHFDAFQAALRAGTDITGRYEIDVLQREDGHYEFRTAGSDVVLVFTPAEVNAFHHGVVVERKFDAPASELVSA